MICIICNTFNLVFEMTTPEARKKAMDLIKQGEELRLKVYNDSKGLPTIGWGHLLRPGQNYKLITKDQADKLLEKEMPVAIKDARNYIGEHEFSKLSPERQAVLIDMSFNLGGPKIQKFVGVKKAIIAGDFKTAAKQILDSGYRNDVKIRAYRNAYTMKQSQIFTKSQAESKSIHDGLLSKDKHGKLTYTDSKIDNRINKILNGNGNNNNNNGRINDADLAKQADKIKQVVGGVSFDIDPVSTRINGFINQNNQIKLVQGDIYDQSNFSMLDMVVPLKLIYDPEIPNKNIAVSLDPLIPTQPDGPWYRKVYYPKQLTNTDYGHAMIEADALMKQLSLGVDQNNQKLMYPEELREIGLDIQSIFQSVTHKGFGGSRTRLWIVIKDYEVSINQRFFEVNNLKMGVELKALQISENGSLRDCNDEPSPIAKKFSQIFTKNYDLIATYYPIFAKMKRLAKASIIAKIMYFKKIPIDMDLINKLYKKQVNEYEEKYPRLGNKLVKSNSDRVLEMSVIGGCSFDISNIQNKVVDLEKQVKQTRELFQAKNINSNSMPLKVFDSSDKQNIGNYNFIKDQSKLIKQNKLYPFLFQNFVSCKHCSKVCGSDYYSIVNKQCFEHSSMKCKICKKLILPGQAHKANADKSMVFHQQCFKCSKCHKNISGPFASIDGGQYHPDCVPKKSAGTCAECKKEIYQTEQYAQNPQNQAIYHAECAKILQKRIQDSIPVCKQCKVKLQGQYVKYKDEPYHRECAEKMLGQN